MAKGKFENRENFGGQPDDHGQTARIEQSFLDFAEAFLDGKATIEVMPRGTAEAGYLHLDSGFTIRLRRD